MHVKAFSQNLCSKNSPHTGMGILPAGSQAKCKLSGSMTVEAALVMPIFLFFMLSVLYIFQIISVQAKAYMDLHQRGNRIAFEAYRHRDQYDDGIVELTESYHIMPYLLWQDFGQLKVVLKYYGYAFIGYDVSKDSYGVYTEDEELVYITETGTVYHLTMGCSHLKITVSGVEGSIISSMRNDSGGKYYPCEWCPLNYSGLLFITSFGTRYHSDVNCSGLKRTVSAIEMKEALIQGYRACLRCR